MSENSETTRFGTRRGYLLNRFAWSCGGFALITVFFLERGYPHKWLYVIVLAALAAASWWLGNVLDKKARRTVQVDEHGNARKKVL